MHKYKSPKKKKFRLLLDSAFASPKNFSKLNKKTSLAHVVDDCGLSRQAEDQEIYEMAVKENRFVLTINFKHFRSLVRRGKPGIFGIESQLSNKDIDICVCNFLSGKDPNDFIGKAVKIPSEAS